MTQEEGNGQGAGNTSGNRQLAEKYYGLYREAYKAKQYEAAIAYCNQAIEQDPSYANAYNGRGVAYNELKQHQEAIVDYNRALKLDPGDAFTYNNLYEL